MRIEDVLTRRGKIDEAIQRAEQRSEDEGGFNYKEVDKLRADLAFDLIEDIAHSAMSVAQARIACRIFMGEHP